MDIPKEFDDTPDDFNPDTRPLPDDDETAPGDAPDMSDDWMDRLPAPQPRVDKSPQIPLLHFWNGTMGGE